MVFCFNPRSGDVGLLQTDCSSYNLPCALTEAWLSRQFLQLRDVGILGTFGEHINVRAPVGGCLQCVVVVVKETERK